MQELRLSLADARTTLRAAKDAHELARAESEQRAIGALNGTLGKNAEERARQLTLSLAHDTSYQQALSTLRRAESNVDRIEALLEAARDDRRAQEWHIRAKLADALFRAGVQTDGDDPAGDGASDDIYDDQAARASSQFGATLRRQRNVAFEEEDLPF